MNTAAPPFVSL